VAEKLYDRIDGKPVAKKPNQSRNTTLEEVILEAGELGEKPAA
jgi:hypothetical protein